MVYIFTNKYVEMLYIFPNKYRIPGENFLKSKEVI